MLEKKFKNQNIILTGQQSLKVYDVMKMLSEILGIKKSLKFKDKDGKGEDVRGSATLCFEKCVGIQDTDPEDRDKEFKRSNLKVYIPSWVYNGNRIWGLTAMIAADFLNICFDASIKTNFDLIRTYDEY